MFSASVFPIFTHPLLPLFFFKWQNNMLSYFFVCFPYLCLSCDHGISTISYSSISSSSTFFLSDFFPSSSTSHLYLSRRVLLGLKHNHVNWLYLKFVSLKWVSNMAGQNYTMEYVHFHHHQNQCWIFPFSSKSLYHPFASILILSLMLSIKWSPTMIQATNWFEIVRRIIWRSLDSIAMKEVDLLLSKTVFSIVLWIPFLLIIWRSLLVQLSSGSFLAACEHTPIAPILEVYSDGPVCHQSLHLITFTENFL